jgi:hypothetical protein
VSSAVTRVLPPGRSQAGDRSLNFHDGRDNLGSTVWERLVALRI